MRIKKINYINIYKDNLLYLFMKKVLILVIIMVFLIMLISIIFLTEKLTALTSIQNCVDLQNIQNNLSEDYTLINDIDCSETIEWNDKQGFAPIRGFSGILEGNDYTISGLYINRQSAGLFDYLCGEAIVRNIKFEDATIIVDSLGSGGILVPEGGCVPAKVTIDNIYAEGNVYGGDNEYIGGLMGRVNRGVTLKNSRFVGYVEGAGGLVGQNDGRIINSSFSGTVNGTLTTIYAGPDYDKVGLTGGFVGWNFGTIRNSFSEGVVYGLNNVGGFVGGDEYVDETWRGEIFDSYSTADVKGGDYKGGFVGYNVGGDIINCYSTGEVIDNSIIGGFLGYLGQDHGDYECYDSYWNSETSGQSTSACSAMEKTTAEMQDPSTYIGWDFDNTWDLIPLNYPHLMWEVTSFCNQFNPLDGRRDSNRKACKQADWKDNEGGKGRKPAKDCYIKKNIKKDPYDDVCMATDVAD